MHKTWLCLILCIEKIEIIHQSSAKIFEIIITKCFMVKVEVFVSYTFQKHTASYMPQAILQNVYFTKSPIIVAKLTSNTKKCFVWN